jgi:hypothetical protein
MWTHEGRLLEKRARTARYKIRTVIYNVPPYHTLRNRAIIAFKLLVIIWIDSQSTVTNS